MIVSALGKMIQTVDYGLTERYYDVIGDHDQFYIWQQQRPCRVFEKQLDGTYQSSLFTLQQHKQESFGLLKYDAGKKQLWVNKRDSTYLLDHAGNILFAVPEWARVIEQDFQGNYWFGKYEVKVLRLQKQKFKRFLNTDEHLLPNNATQCRGIFLNDHQLYVGTYEGVHVINLKNGEIEKSVTGDELFFSMLEDQQGHLWLGYNNVVQLDQNHQNILSTTPVNILRSRAWALFEDRNNRIWVGHNQGLAYLEEGTLKSFQGYGEYEELKTALILFFCKDKNGVIWVGSDIGLYQLDTNKGFVAAYSESQSGNHYLPAKKFQHMYQDMDGVFWLATEDSGLLRWDKARGDLRQYDKNWGLLTSNIYSVYEDDYGYLWMSSFNGLIRFHKETETVQFFTEEDGIAYNEFNRISHHQAEDGHLYFGSQNGVTAFHPGDFLDDHQKQPAFDLSVQHVSIIGKTVQTDYWEDGTPIDLKKLRPGTRVIDLEVVSPDLFWAGNIALHYTLERLEGEDPRTSRESVSFSRHIELFEMHPGQYTLNVRAIQQNGKQLGEALDIPIYIQPPFYYYTSFWLGMLVLLLLAFWGFTKWRTAHLQRQKATLEALVTERTKQVLENQQTIDDQAEVIESMKTLLNQKDEQWLEQFQSIINQRLGDPNLYLPDIIDDMDISRSAFYEKVKYLTQMTPNQYIQELRLTKAKAILDEGQVKTVKEVAFAVGMKQPKYFSKLFKERFGILPSAYFRERRN